MTTSLTNTAQEIFGVRTYWNDDFKEWIILAEDEKNDGKLQMMWELRNDWTEWEFNFLDWRGKIEQPREKDHEFWTLKSGYETITMRTSWPGDRTEWKISDGSMSLVVKTRYNNIGDEWLVSDPVYGDFYMYTEWEGDARDWITEDYLEPVVTTLMKIAIIHVVLMQSAPRF